MNKDLKDRLFRTAIFAFASAQIWTLLVVIICLGIIFDLPITGADILFADSVYTVWLVLIQVGLELLIYKLKD